MSSLSLYDTLKADPRTMFDIKCTHPTLGVMTVSMNKMNTNSVRASAKNVNTHLASCISYNDVDTEIEPETTIEMFYDALADKLCLTNDILMTNVESKKFEANQRRNKEYQERIAATQAYFDDNDGSYYTPVFK